MIFTIPGQPIPKSRPRATTRGGRVRMVTPARTVAYEDAVGWAARDACRGWLLDIVDGAAVPLSVSIVAVLARVKRLDGKGKPTGRVWAHGSAVDADNVAKAILDGMQRGGALMNDRHVVDVRCRLVYAAVGEAAHAEVEVLRVGIETARQINDAV